MADNSSDLFGSISISSDQKSATVPEKKRSAPKKPPKAPKVQKRRSTSGTLKLLVLLIAAVGIYAAIGFILLPHLAKNSLPKYLGEKLHVNLSISDARFNPFNFQLVLSGISVETDEDGEPQTRFLSIAEATVNLDLLSLLRGDLVCSTMDINRLHAQITRDRNKRYNISYLLHNQSKRNQSGIIDFAELPFLFSFNNIKVSDSQIIFDDKSTAKTHHIKEMEIALPAISNFPYQLDTYIHPRFSAVINGSPIKMIGEATLGGRSEDGRQTLLSCDLNDIDIPLYFDYLPVSLPIDVSQGRANGELQISFSPDQEKGSKLKIQFSFTATDLALESRNSKLSLKVPTAKFEGSLEPFNQLLEIQSVLLREPTLSSDGIITRETLANLAPLTMRPAPEDPLFQVIPSISIKLLIADGGNIIIKTTGENKPVRIWHSVQLSIKNFSNTHLLPSEKESSFRLSGEHLSSSAFFTWQGQFDKQNRPGGNLQLNNIDAAIIAPFLGRDSKDVDGTADVSGLLSLALHGEGEKPFDYTLKSTKVTVKNLKLKDNGVEWLSVPTLRCEPVSRINNITDLGNVFLKNSSVVLDSSNLPHLFQRFSERPTQHVIHGIDFSGTVRITDKDRKIEALDFTDTIFQANRLEQQQVIEENFVFTATVNKAGSMKTTGSLHIAPLQISTEIAFSGLTPEALFSWFSSSPTFRQSQGRFSGQGIFRYPQKEYQGALSAENIVIGSQKNPAFQATKIQFDKMSWVESAKLLSINYILVEEPEFSWLRTDGESNPATPLSVFLRHIFLPEPGSQEADPDETVSGFSLSINQIDINNGAVAYQDNRTLPPLVLGLTSINGNLNQIEYPVAKGNSDFELTGNIEGNPFNLEGNGRLVQNPPAGQFNFTAQSLPVDLFSKQITEKIKDIDPSNGTISIQASTQFGTREKNHSAKVVVSNLLPKESGSSAALALSLLTEPDGTFVIDLETSGDQQAAILTESLSYVGTSIIKTSINPLLLADDNFKDLVDNQYISFSPGSSQISSESIERLNRFSEFLSAHPLIKLKITGYVDKVEDYNAIYNNLVELERKQTKQKNEMRRQEWEKQKAAELELIEQQLADQDGDIKETDIPINKISEFVPVAPRQVDVTDTMLQILAGEREKNAIGYLVDQLSVPANRVEPADSKINRVKDGERYSRADIALTDLYSETISKDM